MADKRKLKKFLLISAFLLAAVFLLAVSSQAIGELLRLTFGASNGGNTGGPRTGTDGPSLSGWAALTAAPSPLDYQHRQVPGTGVLGSNSLAYSGSGSTDVPRTRSILWPDDRAPRGTDIPGPGWLASSPSRLDWRPEAGPPLPGFTSVGSPTSGGDPEEPLPASPPPTVPTPIPASAWLLASGLAALVRLRANVGNIATP